MAQRKHINISLSNPSDLPCQFLSIAQRVGQGDVEGRFNENEPELLNSKPPAENRKERRFALGGGLDVPRSGRAQGHPRFLAHPYPGLAGKAEGASIFTKSIVLL